MLIFIFCFCTCYPQLFLKSNLFNYKKYDLKDFVDNISVYIHFPSCSFFLSTNNSAYPQSFCTKVNLAQLA